MKYEIKVSGADPFDVMCSDCPVNEIEWWESATLEDLRDTHAEELAMDEAALADPMFEEMEERGEWRPTPSSFDEWLKESIEEGRVRIAA